MLGWSQPTGYINACEDAVWCFEDRGPELRSLQSLLPLPPCTMKLATLVLLLASYAACAPMGRLGSSGHDASIRFTNIMTSGSGCPQTSVTTDISSDSTSFTVGFDKYQTIVGLGVDGSNREKYCDIFVSARFLPGCTSTVFSFVYHGFAQLEEGIVGTLPVAYIFSPGSASNSLPPTTFTAGSWVTGGVYTRRDSVAVRENIRNANEKDVSLVIRTRIMLNATNGTVAGTLTMDDVSIAISKQQGC
ncbi:hypothetical protein GE09DRAFT_727504 [Coniochaeta sp. 2T2.1]|nr:hypothetical protein GE09DRAFT_727504 [Coniochaeta sp. 2T2.1]